MGCRNAPERSGRKWPRNRPNCEWNGRPERSGTQDDPQTALIPLLFVGPKSLWGRPFGGPKTPASWRHIERIVRKMGCHNGAEHFGTLGSNMATKSIIWCQCYNIRLRTPGQKIVVLIGTRLSVLSGKMCRKSWYSVTGMKLRDERYAMRKMAPYRGARCHK